MKKDLKEGIINALKGFAIGAANVIPGVSGGTIALITGIFERLVNAVKSFDVQVQGVRVKFVFSNRKWLVRGFSITN